MLEFLTLAGVAAITYFVWKIADQLPDLLFRIAEIQCELGEIKRHQIEPSDEDNPGDPGSS